jgi:hypothetical protein
MHENGGARVNQPLSLRKANFQFPGQALGKQSGGSPPPSATAGVVVPTIRKSVTKINLIMVFFMFFAPLESVEFAREKAALRRLIVK